MHHFADRNGALHAEDVPLTEIAAAVGTPVYVYSSATMLRHYHVLRDAMHDAGVPATVCYAVKANGNLAVLRTLARAGAGADVVSGGELRLALAAGIPPERIVFSGVGKTEAEIRLALETGIHQINVESEPELVVVGLLAEEMGTRAEVALRVNPDVTPDTHAKIATGGAETKFGIPESAIPHAAGLARTVAGVDLVGLAVHIGSQLTDFRPFALAFERLAGLTRALRADGHAIRRLDLGGGIGVPYEDHQTHDMLPGPRAYAQVIRDTVGDLGCALTLEPGRMIMANAGLLLARVITVKRGALRPFVVLDAAMNDLLRPAMYGAYHAIRPVLAPGPDVIARPVDVVGPVCETGDAFAISRPMAPVSGGDLVAILSAGAYGAAMASAYNARPLVPEVLVNGRDFAVVRRRPTFAEMTALEQPAPWL